MEFILFKVLPIWGVLSVLALVLILPLCKAAKEGDKMNQSIHNLSSKNEL